MFFSRRLQQGLSIIQETFSMLAPSLGPTNENLPFTTGADQVFKRRCVATVADAASFVAVGEPMEQGGLRQLSKEIDGTDARMWRETDGFLLKASLRGLKLEIFIWRWFLPSMSFC